MFLFFNSCSKDHIVEKENQTEENNLNTTSSDLSLSEAKVAGKISSIPFGSISQINGILSFTSRAEMKETLDKLRDAKNIWTKELNTVLRNKSKLERSMMKYDENYPYTLFENNIDFNSLKSHIEKEIDLWLQTEDELDFDIYPGNHPVKDAPTRAIYNEFSEIVIGNSIFKEFEQGLGIEIPDLNFQTLQELRQITQLEDIQRFAKTNNLNLLGYWDELPLQKDGICSWWKERTCRWLDPTDDKKRLRGEVGVYNSSISGVHKVWGENDSFFKTALWWVKLETDHLVDVRGRLFVDNNCSVPFQFLPASNQCMGTSNCLAERTFGEETVRVGDGANANPTVDGSVISRHRALNMDRNICIPKDDCSPSHCGIEPPLPEPCSICPEGFFFDGANCHSGLTFPNGFEGFIYGNGFYVQQNCDLIQTNDCCPDNFTYDGANCYSGVHFPANQGWDPFVWNNAFYVHPHCP